MVDVLIYSAGHNIYAPYHPYHLFTFPVKTGFISAIGPSLLLADDIILIFYIEDNHWETMEKSLVQVLD